jgi:hypothetical protein
MSSGTGPRGTPPTDWAHVAASEAKGAHQDTGEILKFLKAGSEEADPIATIIYGQDRASSRLKQILELLHTLVADLQAVRDEQLRQGEEIAVLRRESGDIHPILVKAKLIRG